MKYINYIVLLFTFGIGYAQQPDENITYYPQPLPPEPCYYSSYSLDKKGNVENLQTEPVMVEEWVTPNSGRIVDFTLVRSQDDLILIVEIHQDAKESLQPVCFGRKTQITFTLKNGQKVTLPQIGLKRCGFVNVADEENNYYNITNLSYFKISNENAERLKASELNLASIESSKYKLDFVIRSEIYDEVNDMYLYPEFYFISELDCMLNPTLPRN
jgi:hypothetical protein